MTSRKLVRPAPPLLESRSPIAAARRSPLPATAGVRSWEGGVGGQRSTLALSWRMQLTDSERGDGVRAPLRTPAATFSLVSAMSTRWTGASATWCLVRRQEAGQWGTSATCLYMREISRQISQKLWMTATGKERRFMKERSRLIEQDSLIASCNPQLVRLQLTRVKRVTSKMLSMVLTSPSVSVSFVFSAAAPAFSTFSRSFSTPFH
eukprot:320316-Hanusia_phi.AAC.1